MHAMVNGGAFCSSWLNGDRRARRTAPRVRISLALQRVNELRSCSIGRRPSDSTRGGADSYSMRAIRYRPARRVTLTRCGATRSPMRWPSPAAA